MDNEPTNTQNAEPPAGGVPQGVETAVQPQQAQETSLKLPLIALGLVLGSILIPFIPYASSIPFVSLMLILGVALAIISLARGKARIGMGGMVISIIAIAIPIVIAVLFAIVLVFYVALGIGMMS